MKRYTAQEMRDMAEQILHTDDDWYEDAGHMLLQAADMMERESTSEKSSAVGDAAAIREALEALVGVIDNYDSKNPLWWHSGAKGVKPLKDARAALTAPPRNCDIGTAEEQTRRFVDFCYRSNECVSCQMEPKGETDCILAWAQTPYKKGDEK